MRDFGIATQEEDVSFYAGFEGMCCSIKHPHIGSEIYADFMSICYSDTFLDV